MSLKCAILATLSRHPKSGYEIAKGIEGGIGFFWNATHQQIYKELSNLENNGLVTHKEIEQTNAPTKKVYKLSAVGRKELRNWIADETEPPPCS
jgi:DNA-binding PadR family transcriptional regulator